MYALSVGECAFSTVQNVPKQMNNGEGPFARRFHVRLSRVLYTAFLPGLGGLSEELEESGCYVQISDCVFSQEDIYKNDVTL